MNFFEHQEQAKKQTSLLITYFIIAVAMIILIIYLSIALVLYSPTEPFNSLTQLLIWDPNLFTLVSCGVLGVVVLGSTYKMIALSKGGDSIATELGGILLNYSTTDPDEKKIINIVEEMSIASGIPVPRIYLLENENSINAFAAGNSISNAVIGVTRGSITLLNRDELQGVIAHEFSHILNGDMNLNLRLIGILHGILLIGLTGEMILRSMRYGRSSRGSKKDGGAGALILIALTLFSVGYIGVFFGKLIKSAVSRQREFLADASAVQFTRLPGGIAGALKKIGGLSYGSKLITPKAQEASHMFFSNGLRNSFLSLLATHPPLIKRIQRIEPTFKGDYPEVSKSALHMSSPEKTIKAVRDNFLMNPTSPYAMAMATAVLNANKLTDSIGTIGEPQLEYAKDLIKTLPTNVSGVIHDTYGARAIIYALLLSKEVGVREDQITKLAQLAEADVIRRTINISQAILGIEDRVRLPLAFLTIPALKNLSVQQYEVFKKNINDLIAFDNQQTIFEFCLKRIITQQLDLAIKNIKVHSTEIDNLNNLEKPIKSLIWSLAVSGHSSDLEIKESFIHSIKTLDLDSSHEGLKAGVNQLDKDLTSLNSASPRLKKQILDACVDCVTKDGKATLNEAELLRTIAISLECPTPPLLQESSKLSASL
jgi:Zn-dependent protease with chaperone function